MNVVTQWQRRLASLLVAALFVATPRLGRACDVVVTGGQPVIVNIYLDPITGTSSLSGVNIAAFVQGTGPGCNEYQFYQSTDKTTYIGNQIDFDCSNVSPLAVTYVVRMDDFDGDPNNGNESNPVQLSVVVHDNTIPTVSCPSSQSFTTFDDGNDNCLFKAIDGSTIAPGLMALIWSDNCGEPAFRFNGSGAWQTGDNLAAPFHDFPKGTTIVNYRVTDAGNHVATCNFTVKVNDVSPPIMNNVPDDDTIPGDIPFAQILAYYAGNNGGVTAYDSCDAARPVVYTAVADTLDDCPVTHTILRTWTASDLSGNFATVTQLISVMDTFAPVVAPYPSDTTIFTAIDDQYCEAYFEINPLSFSVDCSPADSLEVEYWLDGYQVTYLDGYYQVGGPYEMEFIVRDQCGNADTTEFNLYVYDLTPPNAYCAGSVNVALNPAGFVTLSPFPFNQGSYDNCSPVDFYVDPNYFDCSAVGTPQQVTLYVYDYFGNVSSCTSIANIQDNTPPVLTCPADRTFSCAIDETLAGQPVATDACGMDDITLAEQTNNQTGPHCFTRVREYTAFDVNGNTSVCYQYLTVEDNFAPVLLNVPADTVVACGTILPDPVVTSFDTCDGSHILQPTVQIFLGADCQNTKIKYYQVRTWEDTDLCGNYAITQDTVKFIDTIGPDVSAVPTDLIFYTDANSCDGAVEIDLTQYSIFDDCGNGAVTVSPSSYNDVLAAGDYTFYYSAVDQCDNVTLGEITFHVVDNTLPSIVCQTDINVSLDNTGLHQFDVNELVVNATDNCGLDHFDLSQQYATCFDASLEALGFGPTVVDVTYYDVQGNSNTCSVIVHVTAPPDIAISIDSYDSTDPSYFGANDGSVEITAVSGGSGDYSYAVLDYFTGNIIAPTYYDDTLTAGAYLLGVQDNVTSCVDLEAVFLNDGPLPLIIADTVSGPHGDTLCVAITVSAFQNIVSAQMDISVPDASVAEVISVTNWQPADFDLAVLNPPTNDFTVSMMNPSTSQVDLVDGDTLFCINVVLTGGLFDTTSVTIVDGSVEIVSGSTGNFFQLPSANQDGFVAVNSGQAVAQIEGDIFAWYGPTVAQVDVDLNGGQDLQTTGADGHYAFTVAIDDPCVITPSKDINYVNGVSVFDLYTIQRHILGDPNALAADPYRYIAADANGDGEITTFDLVELQYIVLNPVNADILSNTSWRFVPTDYAFPNPVDPWSPPFPESIDLGIVLADSLQNNFVAVKIGDVDGDADVLNLKSTEDRSPMLFEIADRSVEQGETIALPILAHDFINRLGWQMTLNFDPQLFDYQGVSAGELTGISENSFGRTAIADGKLTTAWFSSKPASMVDGSVLFTLYLTAKKGAASVADGVKITSDLTPAIGIDGSRQAVAPQLVFSRSDKPAAAALNFDLAQNRPNPFADETVIGFTLPEAATATLDIIDAAGRLVKTSAGAFEAGRSEFKINRAELSGPGVYFYEVKTENWTARRRMVLVE